MKQLFFLALSFLLISTTANAQDYKDAKKAYNTFLLDAFNNKPKLKEAKEAIDKAMGAAENQAILDAWLTKGKIYNEIAAQVLQIKSTGLGKLEELPQAEAPAIEAYTAYAKALPMVTKKFETKDILTGLQAVQGNLDNFGRMAFEEQKYKLAYENFQLLLASHEELKKNAQKSILDTEEAYNYALFLTATAALLAEKNDVAKPLLEKLYQAKYDKAAIYESLYTLNAATDINAAYTYLDEGRKRYPEEISLLFADINHHLKLGKLDILIDKLKAAIAQEPNNVSLYTVLGSVYDNLYQKSETAGDKAKGDEYFNAALDYYNQAIAKDAKNVDAVYSIGALYYNKAAVTTQKMNASENDYSKEGLKKYKEMKEEVFAQFEKALPFFKRAESLDPNDTNTLIALKEIHAKKNELEASKEFKRRLEVIQGGGKNDKPYYQQ
jgi:tetratricopeptide (TPR) repeat protein